jgi:hypothetical protein
MTVQRYQGNIPEGVVIQAVRRLGQFFPMTGDLTLVEIGGFDPNPDGDLTFDVRLDGASIYSDPANRPVIVSGDSSVSQDLTALALSVPTTRGQKLEVFLAVWPSSGLSGPGYVELGVDDGIAAGLSSDDVAALIVTALDAVALGGDVSGGLSTALVNQLKGRSLGGVPATAGFLVDSFDSGAMNTSLWFSATASQHDGVLNFAAGTELFSNVGRFNFTDRYVSFKAHVSSEWVFRIANGPIEPDGDTYIQAYIRVGVDIRFGVREAHNTNYIAGFGNGEAPYVEATYQYMRIEHKTSTGKIHFYRSPTGADGSWVELGSYTPAVSLAVCYLDFIDVSGTAYIDDFDSNIPVADPMGSRDLWALHWDGSNNRWGVFRNYGIIPVLAAGQFPGASGGLVPAGAPANLPGVGYTYMYFEDTVPNMTNWAWSPGQGNWQKRLWNS